VARASKHGARANGKRRGRQLRQAVTDSTHHCRARHAWRARDTGEGWPVTSESRRYDADCSSAARPGRAGGAAVWGAASVVNQAVGAVPCSGSTIPARSGGVSFSERPTTGENAAAVHKDMRH
jgi:hypothetical protein